jgi:hypothetical protein
LSSDHRSQAVAALCETLNGSGTFFPGTRLRIHFAVAGGWLLEIGRSSTGKSPLIVRLGASVALNHAEPRRPARRSRRVWGRGRRGQCQPDALGHTLADSGQRRIDRVGIDRIDDRAASVTGETSPPQPAYLRTERALSSQRCLPLDVSMVFIMRLWR